MLVIFGFVKEKKKKNVFGNVLTAPHCLPNEPVVFILISIPNSSSPFTCDLYNNNVQRQWSVVKNLNFVVKTKFIFSYFYFKSCTHSFAVVGVRLAERFYCDSRTYNSSDSKVVFLWMCHLYIHVYGNNGFFSDRLPRDDRNSKEKHLRERFKSFFRTQISAQSFIRTILSNDVSEITG